MCLTSNCYTYLTIARLFSPASVFSLKKIKRQPPPCGERLRRVKKVDTPGDCRERVQIRGGQIRRRGAVRQSLLSPKAESCRARDSSFFFYIPYLKLFFYTDQLFSAFCAFIDSLRRSIRPAFCLILCQKLPPVVLPPPPEDDLPEDDFSGFFSRLIVLYRKKSFA